MSRATRAPKYAWLSGLSSRSACAEADMAPPRAMSEMINLFIITSIKFKFTC